MSEKSKKTTKKQTRKSAVKKTVSKRVDTKNAEAVTMPTNMSIRAKEKVSVLNTDLEEYMRISGLYVSYIAGICFILVGVALLLSDSYVDVKTQQLANIITGTTEEIKTSINDTQLVEESYTTDNPEPKFELQTTIPEKLEADITVEFYAEHTTSLTVFLYNIETNQKTELPHDEIRANVFVTSVGMSQLKTGTYRFIFLLHDIDTGTPHNFKSPKFIVSDTQTEKVGYGVKVESASTELQVTEINNLADELSDELEIVQEVETKNTKSIEPERSNEVDYEMNVTDSNDTDVRSANEVQKDFRLREPSIDLFVTESKFVLQLPEELTGAQLYARPTNALQSQFVGRAVKAIDNWYVHFDSTNLPDAEYEFFALSQYGNKTIQTNSVVRTVSNLSPITRELLAENPDAVVIAPVVQEDAGAEPKPLDETTKSEERAFSEPLFATTTITDSVVAETEQILEAEQDVFEELLQRYAVAIQAGDQTVTKLAEEALENKRIELSQQAVRDTRTTDIAGGVSEGLTEHIEEAKQRVALFEQIRSERTNGITAVDTDKDGVSDQDERLLYKTNPNSADSDNDGVTDGVEIANGYDPNNNTPETVVLFESPKETFGVVREDVFKIESVEPTLEYIVAENDTNEIKQIGVVIKGRALPNSYATLHIFSSPTVVTVRTDVDGNFEYTFDKELEDGTHEVYVAIADNAGKIIAQSNPFTFIKEAQAFTPVDDRVEAVTPLTTTNENSSSSYNLTIGLSVLSFGLILLMLGFTLRRQTTDVTSDSNQSEAVVS